MKKFVFIAFYPFLSLDQICPQVFTVLKNLIWDNSWAHNCTRKMWTKAAQISHSPTFNVRHTRETGSFYGEKLTYHVCSLKCRRNARQYMSSYHLDVTLDRVWNRRNFSVFHSSCSAFTIL